MPRKAGKKAKAPEEKRERVKALLEKIAAPKPRTAADDYSAHKERARARQAEIARSGRDIGPLPPPENPKRRAKCEGDFRAFCESYFPDRFPLAWSPDHLTVIDLVVRVVLEGLLFALAMPRGSGKTAIFEVAALWAILYGHRRFVVLIGASKEHAEELLDSIMTELESNELLAADFPEVCVPLRALEGIRQRCKGQMIEGKRTRMVWRNNRFILPTIDTKAFPWVQSSAGIIHVVGILGRVRGIKHTRDDGTIVRPDQMLVDDPQSDSSATSDLHIKRRMRLLNGDLLGMKGPGGKRIAALAAVTVIAKGDMADQLVDREKSPEWNGMRIPMVKSFPANERLLEEYAEVRAAGLRAEDGGKAASAFWKKHRKRLEEGAEVYWVHRFDEGEVSAVQHAINLRLRDEAAFFAEYQQEPIPDDDDGADERITPAIVEAKVQGVGRRIVPLAATHLTSFIDVQRKILVWMTVAWWDGFGGHVIDYGTWPDQGTNHWTRRSARRTMARARPGCGLEAQAHYALTELTNDLVSREYKSESGAMLAHSKILIDSGEGQLQNLVYQFCRESEHKSIVLPSKGMGIGPARAPISEWTKKPGDQIGEQWRISSGTRHTRFVVFDTNYWKSFVAGRLKIGYGDSGSLSIFKASPALHRVLIEHLTAEVPVETRRDTGRVVYVWNEIPQRDNDLFDCLVGCAVAASIAGVTTVGHANMPKKRKRLKLSELVNKR